MPYSAKCQHCGKSYDRLRSDGKFCSDNCRVKHARLPLDLMNKASKARNLMDEMRALAVKYPELVPLLDTYLLEIQQKATQEWVRVSQLINLPETKKP